MKKPVALILAAVFAVLVVGLLIVGIVQYEKQDDAPLAEGTRSLVLCLVTDVPNDHMQHVVDKLPTRWPELIELGQEGCDAELRFSLEPSPIQGDGYAPGIAARDCPNCMPYAVIYKDGWEGGILGAGQFVLDHEVGHLLCLGHWPDDSGAVMRSSMWGGGPDFGVEVGVPQAARVTPDVLAAARSMREADCIGPVEANVR